MKKLRVAILMGGISAEKEISLASGKEVVKALVESEKYEVKVYDPKKDLGKLIKDKDEIDVVLPILHGPYGEDGTIQGFLELLQIPYGFSNVLASALGMNKLASRKIFEKEGLLVPRYQALSKSKSFGQKLTQISNLLLKTPLVVKPNTQGSSVGVSICKDKKEFEKGLKEAFKYDETVIVEEYIKGTEITGGVLGKGENVLALPVVEIVPKKQFFNYQAKYDGSTEEIVPARISKELTKKAERYAKKAHQILDCSGVTRTDMILKSQSSNLKAQIYVLEINTIPGFTEESLIPKAAKAAGISFKDLIDKIIELALGGHNVSKGT